MRSFFVAKSQALDGRAAEVRATFGLDRYLPGRGMLDPEALARMRPVLDALQTGLKAARDNWHAYVEGNAEQLEQFQTQLARMQPQAQMLESSGLMPLLDELAAAAIAAVGREGDAREQMNLEVASTLLFMQNAVDQEDVLHADFAVRADGQQARLRALIEGREMPANVVESASQREAERDMLVHMAQEVGQNLKQMEEALDAFFRDANEREALANLPDSGAAGAGRADHAGTARCRQPACRSHGNGAIVCQRRPSRRGHPATSGRCLLQSRAVYRILLRRACRCRQRSCVRS